MPPKLVVFDLDGTLAEPFQSPSDATVDALHALASHIPIAILSGATFERINSFLLDRIGEVAHNCIVMPVNAAQCYEWHETEWKKTYDETLQRDEKDTIIDAIKESMKGHPFHDIEPHGETIIDREGFIAFTALGVDTPTDIRNAWDPDASKRTKFIEKLKEYLPDYDIYVGGKTTIDIMKKGLNKAYGIRWLLKEHSLEPQQVLFVGDALYEGGNDFPVIETGVHVREVHDPAQTLALIDSLVEKFNSTDSNSNA